MRQRILTLPLIVAAVLTMLWRDVAGVRELTRMLAREGFLWCDRLKVSQQALSNRFLTFPAELFEGVFKDILPKLTKKWHERTRRPLPESVQFTLTKFEKIWIAETGDCGVIIFNYSDSSKFSSLTSSASSCLRFSESEPIRFFLTKRVILVNLCDSFSVKSSLESDCGLSA